MTQWTDGAVDEDVAAVVARHIALADGDPVRTGAVLLAVAGALGIAIAVAIKGDAAQIDDAVDALSLHIARNAATIQQIVHE